VLDLLRSDASAFLLVASPRSDTLGEASFFTERLRMADIDVRAIVVNRMTPDFGVTGAMLEDGTVRDDGTPHARALADFVTLAARERRHADALQALAPAATLVRVPLLAHDVHDLGALGEMGALLTGWGPAAALR
jgi:anion-transporting  ArsA/GET3 family ATPase